MLQKIKTWALRRYYRIISARAWKGQHSTIHWGAVEIPSPTGQPIHGRLYNASGGAERPLVIYFHGGGWVIGDLQTHHPFCLALSEHADCTVIAIDYRLAPEHAYPAAADDCLTAVRWIAEHIADFGPSNGKLVIAGDSAGGNLAACTCLALDGALREQVAGAALIYPAVDHYTAAHASYEERATGQALTRSLMQWFWDTYLAGKAGDERVFPLRANSLAQMPPTLLVTAEFDPLRDEGIAFAEKLGADGVEVHYRHFADAAHGFACSEGANADHRELLDMHAQWMRSLG